MAAAPQLTAATFFRPRLSGPQAGLTPIQIANPKVLDIPFNPRDKISVSVHRRLLDGSFFVAIKGAPERVLEACAWTLRDGVRVPLTLALRAEAEETLLAVCAHGLRTLALAYIDLDPVAFPPGFVFSSHPPNFPLSNAVLAGYLSLADPPRRETPRAVALSQAAGIRVVMLTGDHPLTAEAIARQCGIIPEGECTIADVAHELGVAPRAVGRARPGESVEEAELRTGKPFAAHFNAAVVTGDALLKFDRAEWAELLSYPYIVLARLSPQQKFDVVTQLQEAHHIVAVTGDRVSDAPALRQADVGVAMASATSVAKDAAALELKDDSMQTLVAGIFVGRSMMDNMGKSFGYTMQHLLPEMLTCTVPGVFFDMPSPISTLVLVFVDLVIDMPPAVALAFEAPEEATMLVPPRDYRAGIISAKMMLLSYFLIGAMETAGMFFIFLYSMELDGFSWSQITFTHGAFLGEPDPTDPSMPYPFGAPLLDRRRAHRRARAAALIALVVQQIFSIFGRKSRFMGVWRNGLRSMFDNLWLNVGCLLSLSITALVIYTPLRTPFVLENAHWECWVLSVPFGVAILLITELRKWAVRVAGPESLVYRISDY